MRICSRSLMCVIFLVLALPWSVRATTVLYASAQELGAQSDIVVRGTVESTESYWDQGRTKILTRTRIAVEDAYKGSTPATVDIIQVGGIVGNIKMTVHGACVWSPGEEIVLFAEAHDTGQYVVSGFSQGKFSVVRDPRTGEPLVRNPRMDGIQLLGAPLRAETRAVEQREVPLEEFISHALGSPEGQGVPK